MKLSMDLVLRVSLLILVIPLFLSAADYKSEEKLRPVAEYYDQLNMLNLYSKPAERYALGSGLKNGKLPEGYDSTRLLLIGELMRQIDSRVHDIDPGIVASPFRELISYPNGLVLVGEPRWLGDKLQLPVTVYPLEWQTINRLIAEFDKHSEIAPKAPRPEEIPELAGPGVPRREIHTWLLRDGRWLKKAVNLVLLED